MTVSPVKDNSILAWFYRAKLSTKLDLMVVMILIPSLFMTAAMVFVASRLQEKSALTASYRIELLNAGALQTGLLNVETGLRGYALSAQPEFLGPYKLGLEQIRTARENLDQNRFFQTEYQDIKAEVDNYLAWVQNQLKLGSLSATNFKKVIAPEGKVRFDRLRVLLTDLSTKSQNAFLSTRKELGGLITTTHVVENYPGVLPASGWDMMNLFLKQMEQLEVEMREVATAKK